MSGSSLCFCLLAIDAELFLFCLFGLLLLFLRECLMIYLAWFGTYHVDPTALESAFASTVL